MMQSIHNSKHKIGVPKPSVVYEHFPKPMPTPHCTGGTRSCTDWPQQSTPQALYKTSLKAQGPDPHGGSVHVIDAMMRKRWSWMICVAGDVKDDQVSGPRVYRLLASTIGALFQSHARKKCARAPLHLGVISTVNLDFRYRTYHCTTV